MKDVTILYEDNHIIVAYKPAGMPVQEDESGDPTMLDQVKWFLKQKYQKPGAVFLGLVHRLDRPVSGVMVFGKTSKGASRLSEQIRAHSIEKEYHALVHGSLQKSSGTLIHFLKRDANKKKTFVVDEGVSGAEYAELLYEVVEKRGSYSLLRVILHTGRHHQIRTQLSHIGHPIVGDIKYGSAEARGKEEGLALVATRLSFDKATGNERVEVCLPRDLWGL